MPFFSDAKLLLFRTINEFLGSCTSSNTRALESWPASGSFDGTRRSGSVYPWWMISVAFSCQSWGSSLPCRPPNEFYQDRAWLLTKAGASYLWHPDCWFRARWPAR